jgi:hypothetical protein
METSLVKGAVEKTLVRRARNLGDQFFPVGVDGRTARPPWTHGDVLPRGNGVRIAHDGSGVSAARQVCAGGRRRAAVASAPAEL